jgi:hypothetical protein
MGIAPLMDEREKPQPAKWPFDPMQPGDHEPVEPFKRNADEPVKTQHAERRSGGDRRRGP